MFGFLAIQGENTEGVDVQAAVWLCFSHDQGFLHKGSSKITSLLINFNCILSVFSEFILSILWNFAFLHSPDFQRCIFKVMTDCSRLVSRSTLSYLN